MFRAFLLSLSLLLAMPFLAVEGKINVTEKSESTELAMDEVLHTEARRHHSRKRHNSNLSFKKHTLSLFQNTSPISKSISGEATIILHKRLQI